MLLVLATIELASCLAAMSAIDWLRLLAGQRGYFSDGVISRYVFPVGAALCVVLALCMTSWLKTGWQPEGPSYVGLDLIGGVFLARLVLALVNEALRYRARPHGAHHANRAHSRL